DVVSGDRRRRAGKEELRLPGEVAAEQRRGRYRHAGRAGILAKPLPFLTPKEEQLVFLDGSADGVAEIVITQLGFLHREEIPRVENIVAERLEGRAVKLVGAVLGDD